MFLHRFACGLVARPLCVEMEHERFVGNLDLLPTSPRRGRKFPLSQQGTTNKWRFPPYYWTGKSCGGASTQTVRRRGRKSPLSRHDKQIAVPRHTTGLADLVVLPRWVLSSARGLAPRGSRLESLNLSLLILIAHLFAAGESSTPTGSAAAGGVADSPAWPAGDWSLMTCCVVGVGVHCSLLLLLP